MIAEYFFVKLFKKKFSYFFKFIFLKFFFLFLGLEMIEKLQDNENDEIYRLAFDLIKTYFSEVNHFNFSINNIIYTLLFIGN